MITDLSTRLKLKCLNVTKNNDIKNPLSTAANTANIRFVFSSLYFIKNWKLKNKNFIHRSELSCPK